MKDSLKPLARTATMTMERVGDELVVYDAETHEAHNLNRIAERVWRLCDGNTTLGQITERLRQEFAPAIDISIVETAVQDLGEAGLLAEKVRLPTRRQVAASALLVPVVSSILIPTPAAAKSSKVAGNGKGKGHLKPRPKKP